MKGSLGKSRVYCSHTQGCWAARIILASLDPAVGALLEVLLLLVLWLMPHRTSPARYRRPRKQRCRALLGSISWPGQMFDHAQRRWWRRRRRQRIEEKFQTRRAALTTLAVMRCVMPKRARAQARGFHVPLAFVPIERTHVGRE